MGVPDWWSPPVFRDGDNAEQGAIAYAILRAGTVAGAVLVASAAFADEAALRLALSHGLIFAAHVVHLWLLRRGYVRLAVRSFCVCYFALITLVIIQFGGIRGPIGYVYPPLVLVAGVMWSSRAGLGFAVACSIAGTLLLALDKAGLVTSSVTDVERTWQIMVAVLFITAVTLHVSLSTLRRVRDEAVALQTRLDQAERLEALGRLAGGVAHDFNNQLTAMLAHTALLRRASESKRVESIAAIELAAQHAGELTRQLLEFGRQRMLEPTIIDVRETVAGLRNLLSQSLGPRMTLRTQLEEGAFEIRIDRTALERALVNLILNARDAMPAGGEVVLGVRRVPGQERAGDDIEISVHDQGLGMDEATRAHIFEPFFTTKARGKGTGLGLSSVLGLVAQSGGRVDVDSAPGCGTRFSILLPAARAPGDTERSAERFVRHAGGRRILLVEDELPIRCALEAVLVEAGFQVAAAGSLREALALTRAREDWFELVVTDVVLPDGDGLELLRLLRKRAPQLAAVVVSGYMREELATTQVTDANTLLVHKPFTPHELLNRLQQLLADDARPAAGTIHAPVN